MLNPRASLGAVILGADCAGSRQADRAATTTNAAVRRDVIGVSLYRFGPILNPRASLGAVILGADCAGSRQADRAATTTNAAVRRDVIGVSLYRFGPI